MAGGKLSFDDFMSMQRKEQNIRYKDLSDHDKFRARLADVSEKEVFIPCNYCAHYHGFAKCDAFPDGAPSGILKKLRNDSNYQCSDQYHFEHMGHKWSLEFEKSRTGAVGGDNGKE